MRADFKLIAVSVVLFMVTHSFSHAQNSKDYSHSLTTQTEYVVVNDVENWWLNQFSYEYNTNSVAWIGSLRHAYRFQRQGTFLTAMAYPEFSEDMYAYLMVGASPDKANIYPDVRLSGTLYRNVGKGFVIGPGMQYIGTPKTDVYVYHLKVHYYVGDFLWIGSPSLQFQEGNQSVTVSGSLRKYLSVPNSFISVTVGGNQNPDETFFNDDFQETSSGFYAGSRIQYSINEQWVLSGVIRVRKDHYPSGSERIRTGIQTGITFKF